MKCLFEGVHFPPIFHCIIWWQPFKKKKKKLFMFIYPFRTFPSRKTSTNMPGICILWVMKTFCSSHGNSCITWIVLYSHLYDCTSSSPGEISTRRKITHIPPSTGTTVLSAHYVSLQKVNTPECDLIMTTLFHSESSCLYLFFFN